MPDTFQFAPSRDYGADWHAYFREYNQKHQEFNQGQKHEAARGSRPEVLSSGRIDVPAKGPVAGFAKKLKAHGLTVLVRHTEVLDKGVRREYFGVTGYDSNRLVLGVHNGSTWDTLRTFVGGRLKDHTIQRTFWAELEEEE